MKIEVSFKERQSSGGWGLPGLGASKILMTLCSRVKTP